MMLPAVVANNLTRVAYTTRVTRLHTHILTLTLAMHNPIKSLQFTLEISRLNVVSGLRQCLYRDNSVVLFLSLSLPLSSRLFLFLPSTCLVGVAWGVSKLLSTQRQRL